MKKRYIIRFHGVFVSGYVILKWFGKHGAVIHNESQYFSVIHATKFKYKWVAKFWCWVANLDAKRNCTLKTFEVIAINK